MGGLQFREYPGEVSDSAGLMISILVRYPEVGTLNFNPAKQDLRFTFLFSKVYHEDKLRAFEERLQASIEGLHMLLGNKPKSVECHYSSYQNFTVLEVTRDISSLNHEEISLIISLVYGYFHSSLITENNDHLLEEDLAMQDELIAHMLENIKTTSLEKNIIAFREEGRVLVFNK